ncbi:MAG: hypothetical protein RQ875_04410 [Vicingaceae bacterium]|nr:hypothetical protein [Vicingaceae bacterium]
MEVNKIRKELNELLKNIVEHSESFPANRPIPSLEVSAVISKVNKMQERLNVLRYLLEIQENKQKNSPYTKQFDSQKEVLIAEDTTISEINTTKQIDEKESRPINISDNNKEELANEQLDEASINEVKDRKNNQEIAQKLSRIPLQSLKEAFSLNDRYLYANELFGKDMEAFNNLIKSIDESNNINEAHEKLITAKTQYNWDEENNLYVEFNILIERRFS